MKGKCFQCGKRLLSSATEASSQTLSTVIEGETQIESCLEDLVQGKKIYSRTPMARTLMARLPRLVRTRSWVTWNKFHSCRFGII